MRLHHTIFVVTALSAALLAQQEYGLAGSRFSFSSRGGLGTGAGELLQGVHQSHHRGMGDLGTSCVIDKVRCIIQDQNGATTESYSIVFRSGTDARGPAGLIAAIGPFRTPRGGTVPVAWSIVHTFRQPVALPDCTSFFAYGVRVAAAPRWTLDGQSSHTGQVPRCAHARVQDHAWQLIGRTASHPRPRLVWAMFLQSNNAAFLQMGNGAQEHGMGGMFPRTLCPLTARARYVASSFGGGTSGLFVGTARIPGVVLFPGTARLYLGGLTLFIGSAPINRVGEATHVVAAGLPAIAAGPTFHFQAFGVNGRAVALTNSHSVTP